MDTSPLAALAESNMSAPATGGALILGGTPIGNLSDASPRLREALASADLLAVEDSRTLRKLAAGLGVTTRGRVLVNHDHNETTRAQQIVDAVAAGQTVLLLTDAGMPAVSDPGYLAAAAVAAAGLTVTALPGPSAVVTAIAVSGLPSGRFAFEGFLARKGSDRTRRLAALATEERTMVFYESPHRLAVTLHDFAVTFGETRRAAVCRELTKMHEEIARGTLEELIGWAESKQMRGEIAIVVEGAPAPEAQEAENLTDLVLELVAGGLRLKEACARVAESHGVSKRDLYQAVLETKKEN
ncbi:MULTISPECIES: 16S rRNA (cytidine(1402)-2'-O)-methyltransferase [Rothia]|uniref:Ribosomal RNA small subunit methyltransferase I n=1 Tax=Rothia nasimurium TaxID=85336 RepID=A0A1Y1RLX1_9MICC|nr:MULTISPECIES: 16S rRNA (cytidine(1402)-2'-O)-methyltransferase [Rothia]ORC15434.1 16S rRNA (cytidine(1402)-2'-O)-methyltransferase [Rothia nasimurium]